MSRLIALDDGHGMSTPGKRTPIGVRSAETGKNFMHENEFNRAVVKYLDKHLKASGFRTIQVAPTDADTSLATRVRTANNAKAHLYVSVHANAIKGVWGTWGGTETFTYGRGESLRIGRIIHKHLMKGTPLRDRGVKNGSHLYVIRNTTMPSVLVEAAFMDNKEEAKLLLSDSFRRECAREIAMGICEAFGVKFKDGLGATHVSTPNPSPSKQLYRVRKSWADSKSQKGAYENLQSAKDLADAVKAQGYKVFDGSGNLVYDPAPKKEDKWYRVRKSWKDADSQIGAFKDLDGAKELAEHHAKEGYKVFDDAGKMVFEPKILKTNEFYRVRLDWSKPNTQLGAFKDLDGAKALADDNAENGYKVFDDSGKIVYTPTVKEKSVIHTVAKGDTLWSISQKYSVSVDEIKSKNGLKDNVISVGQKIAIKGSVIPKQDNAKDEPVKESAPKPKEEKPAEKPKTEEKPAETHEGHHDIMGDSNVTAEKMAQFVRSKNPDVKNIDEIAKAFLSVGEKYGVRGDIAFCQSIIETGWFKFDGGTAVTHDQHNYCGLGVTSKGIKGHAFATVEEGVTAQIQHLFAYAVKDSLPEGEEIVDPRFKYVTRGIAPHWEDLSMRWAMNENYGTHIMAIYGQLVDFEYVLKDEPKKEDKVDNPPVENDSKESEDTQDEQFKFWTRVVDYLIDRLSKMFGIKK